MLCFFSISCNENKAVSANKIKIRVFDFVTNKDEFFDSQRIISKINSKLIFVYDFDKHIDSLVYSNNDFYFNNQVLKKIDDKKVSFNGRTFVISKYYYEDRKAFRFDKYLYINNEIGLIFLENLFSGNMYEYDVGKYHILHKNIALNILKFKKGPFEVKYEKKIYKDF